MNDVAEQLEPLLNDVGAVYWFAAPDRLDMVLPILKRWNVVNVLCWDKGNCTAGDLECSYGKQWEAVVFAAVSKSQLVGARDRDILKFGRLNGAEYVHPTQKPVELIEYLCSRHPVSLTLDMFMGSGTTAVACIRQERQFIGIELDDKYFEVACKRTRAAWDLKCSELPFEKPPVMIQRSLID